ncbi:hypothetical protein Tco_0968127 [Tanacetum coccineum]
MAKSRLSHSPLRSPRNDLSLDKTITLELTASVSLTPTTTSQDRRKSKLISKRHSHIPGALHRICMHQGFMIKQMEKKYVINLEFQGIKERVDDVLHDNVPKIASNATNDQIEDNLPRIIADDVKKEREASQATVPPLISKEFADHAPKIIEELFKIHMKNNVINVHPITSTSTATTPTVFEDEDRSSSSNAFRKRDHDDHLEDDAPPKGEKRVKRQKTSRGSKSASRSSLKQPDTIIDEDEVIPEDETLELIKDFQNIHKHVPTIFDHERMEATLRDMMSNQFKDAEEYAYHVKDN